MAVDPTLDQLVVALAASQHGVFGLRQVQELGATSRIVANRCAQGLWVRVQPKAFRIGGAPSTWRGSLLAACLSACGVGSHRSAAYLLRYDGSLQQRPEVTVPRRRQPTLVGVTVHQSKDFDRRDEMTVDGIPVTGKLRTVLDLGAVLRPERVTQTVDHVLRTEQASLLELWDTYAQHRRRGRNGTGVLAAVLEDEQRMRELPESYFERLVFDLLRGAGLPTPVVQHEVRDGHRFIARVDLAYPGPKIAIELLGKEFHFTSKAFERDPARRNRLELLGWAVLEFTWRHYVDTPNRIVRDVADALNRRSGERDPP